MRVSDRVTAANWLTAFIWGGAIISSWTPLPIPGINAALACFMILCLQILTHCNLKEILYLKDKEANFIAIIGIITLVCLFLSKSNPGAFFSIINLCLVWYLSDKWKWEKEQIIFMGVIFVSLYIVWMINPLLFGEDTNSNSTGAINVVLTFTLIGCIKYFFSGKKWTYLFEVLLIFLSFTKVLKFHCRGSLVAIIFYVIIRLLLSRSWFKMELFHKILCYWLTFGSLLFVLIYTLIWKVTDFNLYMPFFNKTIFTGRERIWYELWTYFKNQPLYGIGSNVQLETWVEFNVHNAIYDILIVHGILVFILVMIYIIRKMIMLYTKFHQSSLYAPICAGVFAIYMESFFEMNLIWFPYFLIWTFMLVILNSSPLISDVISKREV